jgi:hypothetical protein
MFGTTSRSHDTMGGHVHSILITHLLRARPAWMGTRNMISNSVHRLFPLSVSPLVFEFSPYRSTQPRSNLRPGYVHFHHSSNKSGTFPFQALTQSCSLRNHYIWYVMLGFSRGPIFRGEATVMTSRQLVVCHTPFRERGNGASIHVPRCSNHTYSNNMITRFHVQ